MSDKQCPTSGPHKVTNKQLLDLLYDKLNAVEVQKYRIQSAIAIVENCNWTAELLFDVISPSDLHLICQEDEYVEKQIP